MEAFDLCTSGGAQTLYFEIYLVFLMIQVIAFVILIINWEEKLNNIPQFVLGLYTIVVSMLVYDILFYQIDIITILSFLIMVYLGEKNGSNFFPETFKISNYTTANVYNPEMFIISLEVALIGGMLIHSILVWGYDYLELNNIWGPVTNLIYKQPLFDTLIVTLTFSILGLCILETRNKLSKLIMLVIILLLTLTITYIKYANVC
ncbi:hypothetical protein R2F61_07370 [Mollicutes bacterium LVI A0078]|nr:hypothetical protein R2F61_07370 [Mollicutes bacterium LVI A0078]